MLDIRDMFEKDKLFFFLEGLQPWAKVELHLLSSAQNAAECLVDYVVSHNNKMKSHPARVWEGASLKCMANLEMGELKVGQPTREAGTRTTTTTLRAMERTPIERASIRVPFLVTYAEEGIGWWSVHTRKLSMP